MSDLSQKFERDGFVVIENVFSDQEIEEMKGAIVKIVDDMNLVDTPPTPTSSTVSTRSDSSLRKALLTRMESLTVPKDKALHKIGHGLHFLDSTFKKITFNTKIQKIFKQIGYQGPEVVQNTSTSDYSFVRNHDTTGGPLLKFIGTRPTYDQSKFQHVPISKGSLILIHGLVVHKSEANTSDKSRHAYTVHVMERKNTKWSEDNWLQETEDYEFPSLFKA